MTVFENSVDQDHDKYFFLNPLFKNTIFDLISALCTSLFQNFIPFFENSIVFRSAGF